MGSINGVCVLLKIMLVNQSLDDKILSKSTHKRHILVVILYCTECFNAFFFFNYLVRVMNLWPDSVWSEESQQEELIAGRFA